MTENLIQQIKKKSVSGAISYTARQLIIYAINIAAALFLAAYLTEKEFGIYGIITLIVGLLTFFSDIGFASALIQKKEEPTLVEYRTVFTIQQMLSWGIFFVTVVIAASRVLDAKIGSDGVLVLMALGFSFPLTTLKTIPSVMLERKLDFSKLVIPHIAEELVYNGVVVACAMSGFGVKSYLFAVLGRSIIGVLVMFGIKRWPMGLSIDKSAISEMVHIGAKFQLNDLIARVKDQLSNLVFAWFIPTSQFGYITFGTQWAMMPYQLTVQNVIAITFPTYARLQHDKVLLKKAIEKTLFFITLLIFPLLVTMSVFIIPFTHVVLPIVGTRYQKWQPALLTFILFTLSIGWAAISTPLTNTLNAIGHINTTLKLMVMWTILTWVVTPICMYFFHFNGVAIATFAISFTSVIPIYLVKKVIPLNIWGSVWRQFCAALIMAVAGVVFLPLWSQSFMMMLVGMVLTAVVYVVTLMVIGSKKVLSEVQSLREK
jgi:O-antigen/teichoic acid export membrane protein